MQCFLVEGHPSAPTPVGSLRPSSDPSCRKMSGTGPKRKHRPLSNNAKITNPNRPKPAKGAAAFRDKSTIRRLAMYKAKPKYTADGQFRSGRFMSRTVDERIKRIEPNRRWFGNTRVIKQDQLTEFRDKMTETLNDPYKYVLRHRKLPMGLLSESTKTVRMDLLQTQSFEDTFGPKQKRKKPQLGDHFNDISSLLDHVQESQSSFSAERDPADPRNQFIVPGEDGVDSAEQHPDANGVRQSSGPKAMIKGFDKGQSKRIWSELYKVIDSSDVIIQVLDARDPFG